MAETAGELVSGNAGEPSDARGVAGAGEAHSAGKVADAAGRTDARELADARELTDAGELTDVRELTDAGELTDVRELTDAGELTDARELTDAVTRLRRVLRAGIRTDISWESLPMAQVEILQSLADSAPTRVNDMAERLHLAQSTVSGLIGQMMTAGLVRRDIDSSDRRAAVVTLTPAGEDQLRAWEAAHVQWIQGALGELSPADRSAISASVPALRRLTDALAAGGGREGG